MKRPIKRPGDGPASHEHVAPLPDNLAARLDRRTRGAGLSLSSEHSTQLTAYLALLAKWNRTINLTAFDLDVLTDAAIDRLVVEPLAAAPNIKLTDALMIDIGSGGGSPALPIKIIAPWLRVVLVESKVRKAAFLREAIRSLALTNVEVDARRAEELLARSDLVESADLVTLRAVRMDDQLSRTIAALLRPQGRLLWFSASGTISSPMLQREPVRVASGVEVFTRT